MKPFEIGQESSPEDYVEKLVEVFMEIYRVLRPDGSLYLNLGDKYFSRQPGARDSQRWPKQSRNDHKPRYKFTKHPKLKEKDLIGLPWMVAFALRQAGYYLRAENIWAKGISCADSYAGSCMPESVDDRPSRSHEQVFLMTKGADSFFDAEAVKETRTTEGMERERRGRSGEHKNINGAPGQPAHTLAQPQEKDPEREVETARRLRTVWAINPESSKLKHFAVMPKRLAKLCLMAGTSARGCCGDCGAPWERVVESMNPANDGKTDSAYAEGMTANRLALKRQAARADGEEFGNRTKTVGWQPTCECHGKLTREKVTIAPRMTKRAAELWGADSNGEYNGHSRKEHPNGVQDASAVKKRIIDNAIKPRDVWRMVYQSELPLDQHPVVPCRIIDPFGGAGTTGAVAADLGLDATLLELNPDYEQIATWRTDVTPSLRLA